MELVITGFLILLGLYTLMGIGFGLFFVFRGVHRLDPATRENKIGFRLLILPGSVALWWLLWHKWRSAKSQQP